MNERTGDVKILAIEAVIFSNGDRIPFTPEESAEGIERLGDAIREWLEAEGGGADG
jgi:hypothetical protein